jgi:hypothetical protein
MSNPIEATFGHGGERGMMTEILVMMAATVGAFGLFLLVFLLKDRSTDEDATQKPTCARCTCQRGLGHPAHLHSETEITEKDIRT